MGLSGISVPNFPSTDFPAGAIGESCERVDAQFAVANPAASGVMLMVLLYGVKKGASFSTVTFLSGGTAAVTPTHQWVAFYDSKLNLLGVTADKLTEAWGTFTFKTFTAPGLRALDGNGIYAGLVLNAATVPNFVGSEGAGSGNVAGLLPTIVGTTGSGLVLPASAPAPAAAITVSTGGAPYAYAA